MSDRLTDGKMARALGAAGIGLGATELLAPHWLARALGIRDRPLLTRALGLREVATGIRVLVADDPHRAQWSRVLGDVFDLALVAAALRTSHKRRLVVGVFGALAVLAIFDVLSTRSR